MYHPSSSYHHRSRGRSSYFLPFVSIIILGLIVVLAFQIVDYYQERRAQALENKAAVKIVTGRAEMKIWLVDEWTSALDSSLLHEGDAIRTAPGSRVTLSLLNGSVIRLNAETEVEISGLKSRDGRDEVALALKSGEIWLKRSTEPSVRASLKVETPHLAVSSLGTVFAVSNNARESVRVLEGKVAVQINVSDPDSTTVRTAETLEVALGQEVSLSPSEIVDLQNRRPVNLLALLSDEFRDNEWYDWNRSEDRTGASAIQVKDAVSNQPPLARHDSLESIVLPAPVPGSGLIEPAPVEVSAVLSAPIVVSQAEAERITKTGNMVITGTVSTATEKIEVTTYVLGQAETYILRRYKSGSENWSYVVSREYANLVPGTNRYTVVAVGKDGKRSDPTEFTIVYDKAKEPADLSAPSVQTFNDFASNETAEDSVKVLGKIGKGIHKVYVNDFALTQYVPDSGAWLYYAKTAYGNLKEGENEYSVYGVDIEGNKTPAVKFTITKKPKPPEAPSPSPAAESAPAASPVL